MHYRTRKIIVFVPCLFQIARGPPGEDALRRKQPDGPAPPQQQDLLPGAGPAAAADRAADAAAATATTRSFTDRDARGKRRNASLGQVPSPAKRGLDGSALRARHFAGPKDEGRGGRRVKEAGREGIGKQGERVAGKHFQQVIKKLFTYAHMN